MNFSRVQKAVLECPGEMEKRTFDLPSPHALRGVNFIFSHACVGESNPLMEFSLVWGLCTIVILHTILASILCRNNVPLNSPLVFTTDLKEDLRLRRTWRFMWGLAVEIQNTAGSRCRRIHWRTIRAAKCWICWLFEDNQGKTG